MKIIINMLLALVLVAASANAQISVPNIFVPGTTILSGQVNANFNAIAGDALNRTGGSIEGNITVSPGVTIDGIDLSQTLGGSGIITANQFVGGGAGLSGLLEANITDGSILARLAASETISGTWTFSINPTISNLAAGLVYSESGATAEEGRWQAYADADSWLLATFTDAGAFASPVFIVSRTGTTPDAIAFTPPINGSRINSFSAQPSFFAYRSVGQAGGPGVVSVLFDAEHFDTMNSYNPGTGTFTAPVAGKYEFCARVSAPSLSGSGAYVATLTFSQGFRIDSSLANPGHSGCGTLNLALGEQVFVQVGKSDASGITGGISGGAQTYFTGRLVP